MTAEEFLDRITEDKGDDMENIYHAMKEFAKYHVQEALKEASDNADIMVVDYNEDTIPPSPIWGVDSYSILNVYPLENIK